MSERRVVILGATGSIGVQALDVVRESIGGDFALRVVGMSAGSSWQPLLAQASLFDVPFVQVDNPIAGVEARTAADATGSRIVVLDTVAQLLDQTEPDIVLNAIVGFAGLSATIAALERSMYVALANKESLVAAGGLCMGLVERHDGDIVPVDSEHSALLQCIVGSEPREIESLVLTASGGPFRGRTRAELADVTVEQALCHPTWNMGGKITIDSATLMNKGLELVEAMHLFDLAEHEVETIVHPSSIVHAMVRNVDGSLLAHLGWPDMRVPISYALHFPFRQPLREARRLDVTNMPALEFHEPDVEIFRCLALAREAARAGGGAPCALNAANEVAVAGFLGGALPFLGIDQVVAEVLERVDPGSAPDSLQAAQALDAHARDAAMQCCARRASA